MISNNLDLFIAEKEKKVFGRVFFLTQNSPMVSFRICVRILGFMATDLQQTNLKRTETGKPL